MKNASENTESSSEQLTSSLTEQSEESEQAKIWATPPKKTLGVGQWVLCLLLLFLLAGGAIGWQVYSFLSSPGSLPARDVEVTIAPGTSFGVLTAELFKLGAVRDENKFGILARWTEQATSIKSGRFRVNTGWTPKKVLDQLINGTPLLDRVTIPEGLTWWETGKRLEEARLVRFEDFKAVVHDPEFLRFWGIPFANAEGFLFPDTYLLMRPLELNDASARIIVGRLIDTFWRRTAMLWPNGKRPGPNKGNQVRDLVTMASIVEKETHIPDERSRVSGVYANRLRTGMLLQADPTIAYGVGETFKAPIRRSQLDDAGNLYNTYKHKGMPPGPICSPGLSCLRAAFQPEAHAFFYFVARGNGTHAFSASLAEHNLAVRTYKEEKEKERKEQGADE
ncbi:MAG: endolytic transglycosylase MltG [Bilophila sp.]